MVGFVVNEFVDRLKLVLGRESVNSFAKRAEIPEGSMRQYLGGSIPGADKATKIAAAGSVLLDWLLTGEGPMKADGPGTGALDLSEFRLIPRLDVQPSSGFGSLVAEEAAVEMLAFRSDWLRRVGINPDYAHVLTNKGDSNEPTIRDGDILLVDTSIDRVMDNAFYVVVYNGQALLKRVQIMLDGSIVLSSDNKNYQPETVDPAEVPTLRSAARLMWFGRSI